MDDLGSSVRRRSAVRCAGHAVWLGQGSSA